jgi:enoyl-CoA hydratase/carnithine racemase
MGHVQVERSQGIVTVTLTNPAKRNAIPAQLTLPQALEAEAEAQIVNFGTKDTAEAMLAFVERREPRFGGS